MAVVDKYANSIVNGAELVHFGPTIGPSRTISVFGGRGEEVMEMIQTLTITAGDQAGSVYRLFNSVPAKYYVDDVEILNPAVTGLTDVDLGFYKASFGPVVSQNALGDALDLTVAHNYPNPLHACTNLTIPQFVEPLWQICGDVFDKEPNALDLALTLESDATDTVTIYVKARFITPVS
jgi:hypothetical protein